MIHRGKRNVIGVLVDVVDYEAAVDAVISAGQQSRPFAVTALAVHGLMTAYQDPDLRARLGQFDLVCPDGQPVRWALNLVHGAGLRDRVYGPNLMLQTCQAAAEAGIGIYLYGSTDRVVRRLQASLEAMFPSLVVSGAEPSKFRRLASSERDEVVERIRASGAGITFVGLGAPRQEVWAYEYHGALGMPVIAVGAAFDFHAGTVPQAPGWMQRCGLEWLFRLSMEPRRLWRRYLILNPWYVGLVATQFLKVRSFPPVERIPSDMMSFG